MSLRIKLVLAFLTLSVVPLTAVTLYSYGSSVQAFRRAAQVESARLAAELAQRMDAMTADLGRRVDRLAHASVEDARVDSEGYVADQLRVPGRIATVLGETAALLDRLEFVPAPPAPGPSGTPLPPAPEVPVLLPSNGGSPPGKAGHPERIVVDLSSVMAHVKAAAPGLTDHEAALRVLERVVETGVVAGAKGAAVGVRVGEALARRAEEAARAAAVSASTDGRSLAVPVWQGDTVLGTVKAELNLERVLGAVLAFARRDQGEIPFAIDSDGRIYTPDPSDRDRVHAVVDGRRSAGRGSRPAGDWIVETRAEEGGLTFGILRPVGDSLAELRRVAARNLALGLACVGLALIGVVPLSTRMTRNLSTLTQGVRRISGGDYGTPVEVRSRDEFGTLAKAFNDMARDVAAHQRLLVEREKLRRELDLCRQIQTEMLPKEALRFGLTEVRGVSIPAREVGGDLFNYFLLPGGRIALLMGDVSGKGISAALLMANVQATLRARLPLEGDLVCLVDALDREIEQNTPRGVYVTLFVAILDPVVRTLRYVNAGHNPQFVVRARGGLERLTSTGLPVGLFAGHGYAEKVLSLDDGDLLFFYTDGMVETGNESDEMFGADRLEALLLSAQDQPVSDLLQRVEAAIRDFRGKAEPFDDATMMALHVGVPPEAVAADTGTAG